MRGLSLFTVITQLDFTVTGSTYDRIGSLQGDSRNGCAGSSSVSTELFVRVTSVTCGGLLSKRTSASELFC